MNAQLTEKRNANYVATRKKKMWQGLINTFVVLVSIASLIPLLIVLFKSFFTFDELSKMTKFYPFPKEWTLDNFDFIFNCDRLNIGQSMFWTFLAAVSGVIGSAIVNTMAGYVFARLNFYGKKFCGTRVKENPRHGGDISPAAEKLGHILLGRHLALDVFSKNAKAKIFSDDFLR